VPYDPALLGSIASRLGSDINFFLDGHNGENWTARCTQRGQIVAPLANACPTHGVVVHPPAGCQTAAVFSLVRDSIADRQSACSPDELLACLAQRIPEPWQPARLGQLLYNRLDVAAVQTTEWVQRTASRIAQCDTLGQCLSGSGSARFCLCADRAQAEAMAAKLQREGNFRAYPFSTWTSPSIGDQIAAMQGLETTR
jgi:4-diphosphocytidyl-2C-methyl-D-erythritol kinase